MARQNGDVAYVRTVNPVGQCSTDPNELAVIVDKTPEDTVREGSLQVRWILVSKWGRAIQGREFIPIDVIDRVSPNKLHGELLLKPSVPVGILRASQDQDFREVLANWLQFLKSWHVP
jgi:hypothetical protein